MTLLTFNAIQNYLQIYAVLRKSKAAVESVNSAMYVAVNADAHTVSLAIIWKAIPPACMLRVQTNFMK